jgi:NTP pyrophosphatase (non-canonical NTP hydrolase)
MFEECHHGWDLHGIPPCEKCETERAPIFHAIRMERRRQIGKFGDQAAKPNIRWLGILAEEAGEVAKVVMQHDDDQYVYEESTLADLRKELIQTAAVAIAWIEKLDRAALAEMPEETR